MRGSHSRYGGLRVEGLSKALRNGGADLDVLRHIELRLEPGEACWVGGDNGAGKTTLLRLIAGILAPDLGSVAFAGLDPERQRHTYQREVGFLSAGDRGLYARISVRRQLELWARVGFIERRQRAGRVTAMLTQFGLESLADRRTDRLSLGQRQRVKLALCFLATPRLVLLDEPSNSLDGDGMDALGLAVAGVCDAGGVVVWCSPPADREALPADRRYLIRDGALVAA